MVLIDVIINYHFVKASTQFCDMPRTYLIVRQPLLLSSILVAVAIWRNRMSYFGQKNRPIVHSIGYSIGLCPTSIFSTKHMDYTINNYYSILQRPRDTHSRLQMTPQVHHSVG
jgi:hypothetical protein